LQFLTFLVEKERIGYVSSILLVFQTLYKKEKNIRTAKVTTATELSDEQKKRFVDLIALKLKNAGISADNVDASFKTDPRIIGGLILEVDGKQIDSSVASKLAALQRQLTV
ncbi:MAG: ATP synthase F1 subunit delta, partial [Bacteroidales bacterium]|nr:ATP synthase F1 subunit delta [Bacteroidales bacterium]